MAFAKEATFIRRLVKVTAFLMLPLWLTGCAIVHSSSNKDHQYSEKLDRVSVVSSIGAISYLSGPIKPSAPFPENFRNVLMAEFAKRGIAATYEDAGPGIAEAVAAENEDRTRSPTTKMTILVKRTTYRTYGTTYLEQAIFDLSIYSIATNRRVWHAEVAIDSSVDVPHWSEATAVKFVGEIFKVLKDDALI